MRNWLRKSLGIDDLETRVNDLEGRIGSLEVEVDRGLRHFGRYEYRTKEELNVMSNQVNDLLEAVDALIKHEENKEGKDRALALRRRLRNHSTRIERNLNEQAG